MQKQNYGLREGKPRKRGKGWHDEPKRHSEAVRKGLLKKKFKRIIVDKAILASPIGPQYAAFKTTKYVIKKAETFSRLQKKFGVERAATVVTSGIIKEEIIDEGEERLENKLRDTIETLKSKKRQTF